MIELRGITVRYPGVVANDEVDLTFYPAEVHCLLGENGAGKTTLVDVLTGMRRPDSGLITIDGRTVVIERPRDALDLGIGRVYQEPLLVPGFTVLENLLLSRARRLSRGTLKVAPDHTEVEEITTALTDLGLAIDVHVDAARLTLGQRQLVEIVRAVRDAHRLLVLDEATALLAPPEVESVEGLLRRLSAGGVSAVFITHRLHEALAVGDRVTVLRRGRAVGTLGPAELAERSRDDLEHRLLDMMFGSDRSDLSAAPALRRPGGIAALDAGPASASPVGDAGPSTPPILEIRDLRILPRPGESGLHGVSLGVAAGEVVGVAGVEGNGQRELVEAVAGLRKADGGEVVLGGRSLEGVDVGGRRDRGLGYVSDDRVGAGSVAELSVAVNAVLDRIGRPPLWRRGVADRRRIAAFAEDLVADVGIDLVHVDQPVRTLSGGNLQKLVVARELLSHPTCVVFSEPTHGLDVRTTRSVWRRILEQAAGGVAVLVVSTDLDELCALADRIVVLRDGAVAGVVTNGPGADLEVGRLMSAGVRTTRR